MAPPSPKMAAEAAEAPSPSKMAPRARPRALRWRPALRAAVARPQDGGAKPGRSFGVKEGGNFRPRPRWRRGGAVRMCGAHGETRGRRRAGPEAERALKAAWLLRSRPTDARGSRAMKGQQKAAETEEGTVQIQEGSVATGEDPTSVAIASIQSAATFPDPGVKYVFRTEGGGTQVMYRVIQVADGQLDAQTEGTSAISGYPATQSMTQAVIQGAFTSEEAVETEAAPTEAHYTYFPAAGVADGAAATAATAATAVVTTQSSEALLGQPTPTGQFFVMMSPQEVLPGGAQRSIAPRAHPYSPKSEAPRATRDEKRRAQHNEVERRRRDKINNWIVQLSKIIPDCSMENTKSGQSKGGILSKACDYIQELRQSNLRLSEELQGLDQLQMDNEVLRQQVEELKNKNLLLRAQLRQHGLEIVIKNDSH